MLTSGGGRIINMASVMGVSGGGFVPERRLPRLEGRPRQHDAGAGGGMGGARHPGWNAIAPTFVTTRLTEKLREDADMVRAIEARTPMGRFAVRGGDCRRRHPLSRQPRLEHGDRPHAGHPRRLPG